MKRVILFLATNLAVVLVLSITLSVLGLSGVAQGGKLELAPLLMFSLVVGFTGAFISLLMSKPMAKWSVGARIIEQPKNATEVWLVDTVRKLSERAGIGMPDVAIYDGEPNAFATGAFKNSALVAVSTGLLARMNHDEVEAVLAHEVAHVANGDMVTLTLVQGVVNTFVVFLARVVGFFVDRLLCRGDSEESSEAGSGLGYTITVIVCEIVFGILASVIVAWFSRQREFRADAGAARLMGTTGPMQRALARLGSLAPSDLPQSMAASGISSSVAKWGALFSSHPAIERRIAALQAMPDSDLSR